MFKSATLDAAHPPPRTANPGEHTVAGVQTRSRFLHVKVTPLELAFNRGEPPLWWRAAD